MKVREYQPGDEAVQISIYNEVASSFPGFKPATLDEIRRRLSSPDKDPTTRLYAIENDQCVGYISFHQHGRVGYPWSRPGKESCQSLLLDEALSRLKQQGRTKTFAAYHAGWSKVADFFQSQGFEQKREMLNFVMGLLDMPTASPVVNLQIKPIQPEDVPAVMELVRPISLADSDDMLKDSWMNNPWFSPDAFFTLKSREGVIEGVSVVVLNPDYADPTAVDGNLPCFRLGAFGTEGQNWKRINGQFSFVVRDPRRVSPVGLDLLKHVSSLFEEAELESVSAQVPSDAPHLVHYYRQYFEPQGKFPLFERSL